MLSVCWRFTLIALFVFGSCSLAAAEMLVRNPLVDAQAEFSVAPGPTFNLDTLIDGDPDILVRIVGAAAELSLGLLEFDIAPLNGSKTVLSASIQLDVNLWTGAVAPEARASVFDGQDGAITAADFTTGINGLVAGTEQVALGPTTIALDPAEVQAVVDTNTDFLGVAVFITELASNYRFGALESSFDDPAELTIEFVPEPATWVLLSAGLAALLFVVGRRRRR